MGKRTKKAFVFLTFCKLTGLLLCTRAFAPELAAELQRSATALPKVVHDACDLLLMPAFSTDHRATLFAQPPDVVVGYCKELCGSDLAAWRTALEAVREQKSVAYKVCWHIDPVGTDTYTHTHTFRAPFERSRPLTTPPLALSLSLSLFLSLSLSLFLICRSCWHRCSTFSRCRSELVAIVLWLVDSHSSYTQTHTHAQDFVTLLPQEAALSTYIPYLWKKVQQDASQQLLRSMGDYIGNKGQ
jgi:hypothetical protein